MENVIRVGGRQIEPLFDLVAWDAIEERFGSLDDAIKAIDDKENESGRRNAIMALAAILCNNALEAGGEEPDITEKQMKRATPPKRLPDVRYACVMAINKRMRSDYDPSDSESVDVVLEEIAKKQNPGG